MSDLNATLLDADLIAQPTERRRKLLPWWMKFFSWVFMIMGLIVPFALIAGILSNNFNISLYGIETYTPISFIGILLSGVYLFKGVTAYGLWAEKDWAIEYGRIDAIIGILICAISIIIMIMHGGFLFKIDIILLIIYLIKLNKIKPQWDSRKSI